MINKLISFGCSWPHGIELIDPLLKEQGVHFQDPINDQYRHDNSYPGLIAAHYGWTLIDRTLPITTLPGMIADFEAWVSTATKEDRAESLVLINLTREDLTGSMSNLPSELTHKVLTDKNSNVEDQVFEWAVATFNNTALMKQVPMLQFNVLARQHKLKFRTLIESSSALEMLVIRDKPRKAPLFAEYKHPNEQGHLILSEFLISKIDSVILNE